MQHFTQAHKAKKCHLWLWERKRYIYRILHIKTFICISATTAFGQVGETYRFLEIVTGFFAGVTQAFWAISNLKKETEQHLS